MRTRILQNLEFYICEMIWAFAYLHLNNIIHRDIKLQNLMIDAEGHVKVIDLGFAKRVKGRTFTTLGTPSHVAPEVILGKGYSFKADVWSFGILICEFLTGHSPFHAVEDPI